MKRFEYGNPTQCVEYCLMTGKQERRVIADHILESVHQVKQEPILFHQGINERTIAHRLAIHIEDILGNSGWLNDHPHVDVEYNRIGKSEPPDPKRFDEDLDELLDTIAELSQGSLENSPEDTVDDILEELQNRLIYPDIVVHERGKPHNLLVIELKKDTSSTNAFVDHFDHMKLAAYTNTQNPDLGYRYGTFLKFKIGPNSDEGHDPLVTSAWFEGGEKLEDNPLEK